MKTFDIRHIVYLIILGLVIFIIVLGYEKHNQSEPKDFFDAISEQWNAESQPWTRCEIPVPDENLKISFAIRQGHPFLAEFERKVTLSESSSGKIEIPIIYDSGGATRLNVFWFSDNDQAYLKFDDGYWCIIDVKAKKIVFSNINIGDSFDPYEKNNDTLESLDWKQIGLIKYDRPDYEKGLLFEEIKLPTGGRMERIFEAGN